jgi:3-dehydroquinate synthase
MTRVESQRGSYAVHLGPGLRRALPALLAQAAPGKRVLVTDANVEAAWGAAFREVLGPLPTHVIAPGEASKSLAQAAALYSFFARERLGRRDAVLALGGGVVGDLAGFAAATYLRGVGLVQLPTTVLAMADSSIGGKVAVDLPEGKNLVGAFHAPRLVVGDTDTLATLPLRERWNGLAEAVKTALLADASLVAELEQALEPLALTGQDPRGLLPRVAALKAGIVTRDEFESGERMLLNLGHTLGHALEAAADFGPLLHGEAVVVGLRAAVEASRRLQRLPAGEAARALALLDRFPRPPALALDRGAVEAALGLDKKGTRFIVLTALGRAEVEPALPAALLSALIDDAIAFLRGTP